MPVGWPELIIVLVIVLLVVGPKRLPQLGRQLGGGMREFKDSVTARSSDDKAQGAARPELTGPDAEDPGPSEPTDAEDAARPGGRDTV
jgi:sec-independent protein translocase protein TatA